MKPSRFAAYLLLEAHTTSTTIMSKYLALLLCLSNALTAQVIDYTFKGHIGSNLEGAFVEGDAFTLTFKLDYSTVDVLPGFQDASFMNAVSDLRFGLDSGSIGNYGGGTMAGSQFLQTADDIFGSGSDAVFFYASHAYAIPSLSFPDVGLHGFTEFGFTLSSMTDTFQSTSEFGQSLGSLLNTSLDLGSFDSGTVQLVFDDYQTAVFGTIDSITVTTVPDEMSVGFWSALSLLSLITARRFRMRNC